MRKKLFKKILAGALTAVMAFSLTACGGGSTSTSSSGGSDSSAGGTEASSGPITVGFSQVGAESDWRTANTESMKSTFSEANGYKLIFDDAQQKQENQVAAIRNFIQQDVDYIVVAPTTESGWDTVLQEAKDAGIPVIIVDRMVDVKDDSLYTAWVGSNFELEGKKAAAYMKAYAEAKGIDTPKIVDIQGTIGASAQIGRTNGLKEAVDANGWNLLEATSGEFTEAKGQEVMEAMLKKYKDGIDFVYCENDNEAFGAIKAIEAAGYKIGQDKGQMIVCSFDTTHAGLDSVLEGKITLNTECNPLHGPRVESIIKQLEAGQTPDKTAYVEEEIFAKDDTVKEVEVDGQTYPVTVVTQEVIDGRKY
ncbi:MAG: ABC transporter substrate-binding protein [Eubacterium sp.]|nr:ABC transporter substrate-binding protein [Eubacterium sp.]